ncbi:hypothetical protein GGX14DRAFT_383301 [Mycena pura]|uniref:PHD-type domain-containing protein n=1 Tax=Mycena pura TaxID=153505 RepID=A0AAD6XXE3_9AGAR|nr:hypothetical protein GGX14DRAFT_383301 [Mycena pura]
MGENGGVEEGEEIRCRCGSNVDDGFSIACDGCGRWCHAACFGIQKESVPEEWICWVCAPQNQMQGERRSSSFSNLQPQASTSKGRRRTSISAGALRASTAETSPPAPTLDDLEDERSQYVHIEDDFIPQETTQRRLRAYATAWRGVSALGSGPPPNGGHTPFVFGAPPAPCPTVLQPAPSVSSRHGAAVLPINYALHAATPAPPRALLARFPSTIIPSSAYLRAPTNGYAHIGAPKRFVHLVGPPLDVALDARCRGGSGRWVRSGCWPNAELRAYVCGTSSARKSGNEKGKDRAVDMEDDGDDPRTHFGIFATRELRQGEEIVVGWEWDDANAVHRMGTLAGGCVSFFYQYSLDN